MTETNNLEIGKIYVIDDSGEGGDSLLEGKKAELRDFFDPGKGEKAIEYVLWLSQQVGRKGEIYAKGQRIELVGAKLIALN